MKDKKKNHIRWNIIVFLRCRDIIIYRIHVLNCPEKYRKTINSTRSTGLRSWVLTMYIYTSVYILYTLYDIYIQTNVPPHRYFTLFFPQFSYVGIRLYGVKISPRMRGRRKKNACRIMYTCRVDIFPMKSSISFNIKKKVRGRHHVVYNIQERISVPF